MVASIFADRSGASRAQRLYFYNKQTNITADLSTEATLQPGEWGAIQLPLGPNLIQDPGFERAFAATSEGGWRINAHTNGAVASIDSKSPRSGQHALMLAQSTPVTFSPEALRSSDYGAFIKSANGGAGGGHVEVEQGVPVTGGHQYSFRINYRSQELRQETRQPAPSRGYSRLNVTIAWTNGTNALGSVHVLDERRNFADWNQLTNWMANYWSVNKPYRAPQDSTRAVLTLSLDTLTPDDLPTIYIDDLELVEDNFTV